MPLDPAIRLAIEVLAPEFPRVALARAAPGRRFIGKTDQGIVRFKALPSGDYRLLPTTLPSGSRIQDTAETKREIRRRLEKANADDSEIEQALANLDAGEPVHVEDDVYVSKKGEIEVGLPYDEPFTPAEAFLAMGFLYLALNAEGAIYPPADGDDEFAEVRSALLAEAPADIAREWESGPPGTSWRVDIRRVQGPYEPAHMIVLESAQPPLVRIRLFRTLVWDVRLPVVDSKLDRTHYVVTLDPPSETGFIRSSES